MADPYKGMSYDDISNAVIPLAARPASGINGPNPILKTLEDAGVTVRKPMGGIGGQTMNILSQYPQAIDQAINTADPNQPLGGVGGVIMTGLRETVPSIPVVGPALDMILPKGNVIQPTAPVSKKTVTAAPVVASPAKVGLGVGTPTAAVNQPAVPGTIASRPDLYESLRILAKKNPVKFQEFMVENPDIPGLGYAESVNPVTGKMERKFIIENPAMKPEAPMTNAQLKVAGEAIHNAGSLAYGIGHIKAADATRQEATRLREAALDEKKVTDFENTLKMNAVKKTNMETGDIVNDYRPWLLNQSITNPGSIHGKYLPEATALKTDFMAYKSAFANANPGKKIPDGAILKKYIAERL